MKWMVFVSVFAFSIFTASLCKAEWYKETHSMMGTEISVEMWVQSEERGKDIARLVVAEMHRIDLGMNPWNASSELAKLNREAPGAPVLVSLELFSLIEKSLYYSRLSHGAFDISFASVGQFYDFKKGRKPTAKEFQAFRGTVNYRNIILDSVGVSIAYSDEKLLIDLGGIAKGYAVDRAVDILQRAGIQSAIVSAGGDSRVIGKRQGRPWVIGIKHPRRENEQVVRIPLENTAISTSGDYERFFLEGGRRYHHIINPTSGESADSVQSVSIISASAMDSDALSTTVFVLGVEEGLTLVNSLDNVDAIIIDKEGLLHYSDDLLMPELH